MESVKQFMVLSICALLVTTDCYFYLDGLPAVYCHPKTIYLSEKVPAELRQPVMENPLCFSDRLGKRIRFRSYERREWGDQSSSVHCDVISSQDGGYSQEIPIMCSWQMIGGSNAVRVIRAQCNHVNEGFLP